MRLTIKQADGGAKEIQFSEGPVHIGRLTTNQVVLSHGTVSKHHAVLALADDGKWTLQDLDSANKTYLNGQAIHKAEVKTGDTIRIGDFSIEIDLDDTADTPVEQELSAADTLQMEASLTTPKHETVVRKPDASHAPAMRLPAKRLKDFAEAAERICQVKSLDSLLLKLLDISLEQFQALHCWCALRKQPAGPMTWHAGRKRTGQPVNISELKLSEKIMQAVERCQSLVLPRVEAQMEEKERIRSAMIVTILRPGGCFGVIYVDNAMIHEHYSLSDLDYLMLIAMHTAAVMGTIFRAGAPAAAEPG